MTSAYAELRARSFYSFGAGASHVHELLTRAAEYGLPALALTDDNLCGALLPHRRMLPSFSRLLIDAHRSQVNRSLLIDLTVFG